MDTNSKHVKVQFISDVLIVLNDNYDYTFSRKSLYF